MKLELGRSSPMLLKSVSSCDKMLRLSYLASLGQFSSWSDRASKCWSTDGSELVLSVEQLFLDRALPFISWPFCCFRSVPRYSKLTMSERVVAVPRAAPNS